MGRASQSRGSKQRVRDVIGRAMLGNIACSFRCSSGPERAYKLAGKFPIAKNIPVGIRGVIEGLRWA